MPAEQACARHPEPGPARGLLGSLRGRCGVELTVSRVGGVHADKAHTEESLSTCRFAQARVALPARSHARARPQALGRSAMARVALGSTWRQVVLPAAKRWTFLA